MSADRVLRMEILSNNFPADYVFSARRPENAVSIFGSIFVFTGNEDITDLSCCTIRDIICFKRDEVLGIPELTPLVLYKDKEVYKYERAVIPRDLKKVSRRNLIRLAWKIGYRKSYRFSNDELKNLILPYLIFNESSEEDEF